MSGDISGMRFNRLVAAEYFGSRHREAMWKCVCDCGNVSVVSASKLRSGATKSCGCLRSEVTGALTLSHGQSGRASSPEYRAWKSMRIRCLCRTSMSYASYGGRGITICDDWLGSFEAFLADMGLRPSPQHSLDRINNDGNYEPANCRWATKSVQSFNRRSVKLVSAGEFTGSLKEIAAHFGVDYRALHYRVRRTALPVLAAISLLKGISDDKRL